jgi:hypothetical protein
VFREQLSDGANQILAQLHRAFRLGPVVNIFRSNLVTHLLVQLTICAETSMPRAFCKSVSLSRPLALSRRRILLRISSSDHHLGTGKPDCARVNVSSRASPFYPVRFVNEILRNTGMFRVFRGEVRWRSGRPSYPRYRSEACKSRRLRKLR